MALGGMALVPVVPGGLAAQDPGGPTSALAAEVEAREIAFAKTMADRDFASFMTFVSDDAVFFAGDVPLRGREAVGQGWEAFFNGPDAPFSWHPDLVEVLESGDLALSTGPVLDASGETVGRFNSIWRRASDGRWLVVFDKGCP